MQKYRLSWKKVEDILLSIQDIEKSSQVRTRRVWWERRDDYYCNNIYV